MRLRNYLIKVYCAFVEEPVQQTMTKYPLFFSYRDLVAGNGFVAGVTTVGRVLLDESGDEPWMYGVQPGGIAGGGADRNTAFCEFKNSYLSVLYDLAAECTSFEQFDEEVQSFFGEINKPTEQEWGSALDDVRARRASLDGLDRVDADTKECSIDVALVDVAQSTPTDSQFGDLHEAA